MGPHGDPHRRAVPVRRWYVGTDVHLGARICAVAWGGQVVVSSASAALVGEEAEGISLRSLGEHALKDIAERRAISGRSLGTRG